MTRIRQRFRIHGLVQGVGFRWWTQHQARLLGAAGHVRNLEDGCVEVEAEGEADVLEQLSRALARGPANARVTMVETLPPSQANLPHPFEIAY